MADDARSSWTMAGIHTTVEIDGGVLVGDDGSACALRAVQYAAAEAARRGTAMHVVRAWSIPTAVRPDGAPFGTTPSIIEMQEATLAFTQQRGEQAAAEGTEVHAHTVFGRAGRALIAAAAGADVLVVGTRGHSRIGSLLVGSTAADAIREAPVPVIVVR